MPGFIYELSGDAGSGKTHICMHAISLIFIPLLVYKILILFYYQYKLIWDVGKDKSIISVHLNSSNCSV